MYILFFFLLMRLYGMFYLFFRSLDTLPTYKTVSVGDKLKVYYGPKHDLKVTYEAKVCQILFLMISVSIVCNQGLK